MKFPQIYLDEDEDEEDDKNEKNEVKEEEEEKINGKEEEEGQAQVDQKTLIEQRLKIPKIPNKETPHRSYCNQLVTPEINDVVISLLSDLRRFYQKQKTINPLKVCIF